MGGPPRSDPKQVGQEIKNSLYIRGVDFDTLAIPRLDLKQLDPDVEVARLLLLQPAENVVHHVQCALEIHPITDLPTFTAIKNARGYRKMQDAIEVDGQALLISTALERFLRHFRTTIKEPTRVWVRHACVLEFDLLEQKRFWTREFSDAMYARASKIIDMYEVNSRLIEDGYFEKVIDSQYAEWKKEWSTGPGQIILPRVCPIRLGTKPNNDDPTSTFQYMPLDMVADEIRIMCIMPSEDISAPIVIHAAHCPIRCEVTFSALSYRWGTDVARVEIVLNGQKTLIRKKLEEAIRVIRMTDKIVPIWIDALSINQGDIKERNRQVARMGQIFDCAFGVHCHVGEPSDDDAATFEFIEELAKHPMVRMNDRGEFHFGEWGSKTDGIWYGENKIKPKQLALRCAALYKFLTRQYFRRSWVLQEVAWASNPTIVVKKGQRTRFETLDSAVSNFQDMWIRDPSLTGQMTMADPSLEEIDFDMLAYPRKLFYFRHLVSQGHGLQGGFLMHFSKINENSPGFLEALVLCRDFEATDPRDHIFALWNIAQDKHGLDFKPRYDEPYEKIFEDFAQSWIIQHRKLDILGAVEFTQECQDFYDRAASWCPNWNARSTTACLVRKDFLPPIRMSVINSYDDALYSADGDMNRDSFDSPLFSFEGSVLECTGIILDEIKFIFDDAPEIPAGTGFPRCDPPSNWKFRCWTEAIQDYYKKNELETYDDPLRAAWAMFHGDNIAAWPEPGDSGYDEDDYHPNEQYLCLPLLSRHVIRYAKSYERTFAWAVVKAVLRGRRPFISENGYMGLMPIYSVDTNKKNSTQVLAIVAGCSVPLLLREREDGSYQLIGTCFVQGWMDGEWIETMMGAENPREFWEMIREDAKLRIP